jgi:type I restriction enzyme, S subunit
VKAVAWGASFPAEWQRKRIKHIFRFVGGGTPDKGNPEYWNGDIPWVSPKDMKTGTVDDTEDHITLEALEQSATRMVNPGAVLIVMRSGILRHSIPVAINRIPVALNQDMRALVPTDEIDPRFLRRLVEGHQRQLLNVWSKVGSTVESLESDLLAETEIAVPPIQQQRAIADYLDRETARIDALIAAKERLLELLAEKSRALITHAVTGGLDPDAPLRDSGIPWLGQVPAHWETVPLMYLTEPGRPIMYGIVLPGPDVGQGVPILKGGSVRPDRMNLASLARTTPEIEEPYARARLRANDLVYSIRGSIGDCEVVPPELEGCNITQDVARIAPNQRTDSHWLRFALLSRPVAEALASGSLGAAVRGINIFDLKRVRIPTPPLGEQVSIASYLTRVFQRIHALEEETLRTIGLSKERRSALIAAAVTGQIDVQAAA